MSRQYVIDDQAVEKERVNGLAQKEAVDVAELCRGVDLQESLVDRMLYYEVTGKKLEGEKESCGSESSDKSG